MAMRSGFMNPGDKNRTRVGGYRRDAAWLSIRRVAQAPYGLPMFAVNRWMLFTRCHKEGEPIHTEGTTPTLATGSVVV